MSPCGFSKKCQHESEKRVCERCLNVSRCQLVFKNIAADIHLEKLHVKAWLRPWGTAGGFFIHDMSESVWCIMLFKLFTQRKEMERKLGELHEAEALG